MEYVNLGKTGLKVSRICLGCMSYGTPPAGVSLPGSHSWSLDDEQSRPFFRQSIELGINFFDTANVYANGDSERVLGRWLKEEARREDVVLATKVNGEMRKGPNGAGLSRKEILFELDESLKRLQTDYVDLYWIHRWDYNTPIEETLETLHDVIRAGKVRYIGASSMHSWQLCKALYVADRHGWSRFVAMQNHYNLLYREEEREMIPLCREENIALTPWSPLARGRVARPWAVTGTARSETDAYSKALYAETADADKTVVDRVEQIANRRGAPMAQVALAWMLSKPWITSPIVGATKPNHLTDAVAALDLKLSDEETRELEEPYVPHRTVGFR